MGNASLFKLQQTCNSPRSPIKNKKSGKKLRKYLAVTRKVTTFALAIKKRGSVAQLNRASDYGSEGYGFESHRSH